MDFESVGKAFFVIGAMTCLIGLLFLLLAKAGFTKLPGDLRIEKEGFTLFFPIVTCLIISVILTILFNIFTRR